MTALASVGAQSVGQGDYLLKDPENSPVQVAAAAVATDQASPSEDQFPGALFLVGSGITAAMLLRRTP
jgi:hypothetical protein